MTVALLAGILLLNHSGKETVSAPKKQQGNPSAEFPEHPPQAVSPRPAQQASTPIDWEKKLAHIPVIKQQPAEPTPPPAVALVDRIEAAVVQIDTGECFGSGFVIDPKGLICTNYHVIDGALTATVIFKDHRSLHVRGYAAVNRGKDLAILAVQPDAPLPSLRLSANLPAKLAKVMAFGAPEGFSGTVTKGNVSSIRLGDEVSKITLDAIHVDICRTLGYDGDSTWIQSTAAISHGSSGGPLVDMQGEVVGINTWSDPNGQSLNFAVAAKEIANLLPSVVLPPRLAVHPATAGSLGRTATSTDRSRGAVSVPEFSITFPSGDMLKSVMLTTDRNELADWIYNAGRIGGVSFLTRPGGSLYGLSSNKNGVLEGRVITVHPNNSLAICASYTNGHRHGAVKTWNAEEKLEYWCQYESGKRQGFCCSFNDGDLQLVLQCDHGKTTGVHLISGNAIIKSFADEDAASANADAGARLEELRKTEHRLLKNEEQIKKEVKKLHRDEGQKIKTDVMRRLRENEADRRFGGLTLNERMRREAESRAIKTWEEHAAERQRIADSVRRASGL